MQQKDETAMTTMFARHQVNDYAQWRRVYDELDPTRQRMGVSGQSVYRAADNPNEVTITHDFGTLEAAQQFAASDELREAMGKAGVAGEPAIWFADKA